MGRNKDYKDSDKESGAHSSWKVRNENGEIFGPADIDTLSEWARDGRLAPTHQVSRDGDFWQAASSLRELQMNWVSEIAPGSFYGPIHQAALRELIQEKSIDPDVPLFHRHFGNVDTDSVQTESDLRNHMERTEREFNKKVDEYTAEISRHKREKEKISAELQAKDMEFEAERNEIMAGNSRQKAEIFKRDSLLEALGKEVEALEKACQGRQAMEVKLHEMEVVLSELKKRHPQEIRRIRQENDRQTKKLRTELEKTKKESGQMAGDMARVRAETEMLRTKNLAMKKRFDTLRKHLEDALEIAESHKRESNDPFETNAIVDPSSVREEKKIEIASAAPTGAESMPQHALATIEAQAQHEIRTLKSHAMGFPTVR